MTPKNDQTVLEVKDVKQWYTQKLTSKKNGKKYWICTDPERECKSIFSDKRGKPDFNPAPAKKKAGSYGKKNFKRKAG